MWLTQMFLYSNKKSGIWILFPAAVDRIMASPKYVHVLIPRTCDYISLPDKRDFVDVMIKLRVLDGELILYYPDV